MQLLFVLELFGNCNDAINFLTSIFDGCEVVCKTFKEMPFAIDLGIGDSALSMIWKSKIQITVGSSCLVFKLSDSVLFAMRNDLGISTPFYKPVVLIGDKNLFERINNEKKYIAGMSEIETTDTYGICWKYRTCSNYGIYYSLSFDGFCKDVIAFYESVFNIKATNVIEYGDTSFADKVSSTGKKMIFSAVLCFGTGRFTSSIILQDSYSAAVTGTNAYDAEALLFYQGEYNPLFELRDDNEDFLIEVYKRLLTGGKPNRPLVKNANGLYGSLIDKYGICWDVYSALDDI